MNRSLLLNGLILGTLLCTGTITARAVDADVQSGIAAAAPRETRAQAVTFYVAGSYGYSGRGPDGKLI